MVAAYRDEKPVLSGGRRIAGWRKVEGKPGWWQVAMPEVREGRWYFRQLFINGQRKHRARSPNNGYLLADGEYLNLDPVQFKYRDGDIKKEWAGTDAELIALHKWVDLRQFIREVDLASHVVTLSANISPSVAGVGSTSMRKAVRAPD